MTSPTCLQPSRKSMKITAIAPWFGSKRTLAPAIVEQLGAHSAYWEPFCGSIAVLMAKPQSSHETINDLHGDVINLARVLADEENAAALYGRLSRVLFDEHRRQESVEALNNDLSPIDRAFHWFIVQWFGRNGFSGTKGSEKSSFAVRWTPGGGHGGQRFAAAVGSIPAWHHRLRRVAILQRDAFEIIDRIYDHPRVAIYVDPPYLKKNGRYEHDFDQDDHLRLCDSLKRFKKARVVVSYYDDECLRSMYAGWTFADHTRNKHLHSPSQRGSKRSDAPEVLILNGPSYQTPADQIGGAS